jgi:hypothetical protein
MQPWQHGVVDSVDYLDVKGGANAVDTEVLRGKTFWDIAGKAGKRVCIINPLLAYPVWPVNGVMVNGPVFITGDAQAYPEEIASAYRLPELGGMVDFPGKKELAEFIARTRSVTEDQARRLLPLSPHPGPHTSLPLALYRSGRSDLSRQEPLSIFHKGVLRYAGLPDRRVPGRAG